jgi:methionyl-tRNA synthetase
LLDEGLDIVWQSVANGNEYVDRQAPWRLAKDPNQRAELETTLGSLVRHLARHCLLLAPYMPLKAATLWRQLGAPGDVHDQRFGQLERLDVSGWRVTKGEPLFPKLGDRA